MSPPSIDSQIAKDERWVIKTFRPLLKQLKVQQIPNPPDIKIIYMADDPDWIRQGMGRCIVAIEQQNLPENVGGMLILLNIVIQDVRQHYYLRSIFSSYEIHAFPSLFS